MRSRARKVDFANGEVHFILEEHQFTEHSERFKDYNAARIKKAAKKKLLSHMFYFAKSEVRV